MKEVDDYPHEIDIASRSVNPTVYKYEDVSGFNVKDHEGFVAFELDELELKSVKDDGSVDVV